MSAANQQGRLTKSNLEYRYRLKILPPDCLGYYLAGFTDGEGCFSVTTTRHVSSRWGWIIHPVFQVYQHPNHREVLEVFQWFFQDGIIRRKSPTNHGLVFQIGNITTLEQKVIPFFNRYLLAVKGEDFKKFKLVVQLLKSKVHFTRNGFTHIVRIAHSMNAQGKQRVNTKEIIFSSMKPG
jgi:hypothetical protein